jgi:hypothetical protein
LSYHVEAYKSGGHTYYRLCRSYRDEEGKSRNERVAYLGKHKSPEEAMADLKRKMERLYVSKDYDRLIEARADVTALEVEIRTAWGEQLSYWHDGKIPRKKEALENANKGERRRRPVQQRDYEEEVAKWPFATFRRYGGKARALWPRPPDTYPDAGDEKDYEFPSDVPDPPPDEWRIWKGVKYPVWDFERLSKETKIVRSREHLDFEYVDYRDDFDLPETEEYRSATFFDFLIALQDFERLVAKAEKARVPFDKKKNDLEAKMHKLEPYLGVVATKK